MKPEPYIPPLEQPLTDTQLLILRVSAEPKGGPYPVKLQGAAHFAVARKLERMGLGMVDGKAFTANARGAAAVSEE